MTAPAPPLSRLLLTAVQALDAVLHQGRSLTQVLQHTQAPWRAATQDITFQVLRQWGTLQALQGLLIPRRPAETEAELLLAVALALLHSQAQAPWAPHYQAFTVVDQAVRAADRLPSLKRFKALINACLRRFLREQADLEARAAATPTGRWNHPDWWLRRCSMTTRRTGKTFCWPPRPPGRSRCASTLAVPPAARWHRPWPRSASTARPS